MRHHAVFIGLMMSHDQIWWFGLVIFTSAKVISLLVQTFFSNLIIGTDVLCQIMGIYLSTQDSSRFSGPIGEVYGFSSVSFHVPSNSVW